MNSKAWRFLPALALIAAAVPGIVAAQVQVQRPAIQALAQDDVRFRFSCRSGRVPLVQPAPDGSVDLECKAMTATPVVTPIVSTLLVPVPPVP